MHERGEASLDNWWTPPPLMSVTVWTRAQGKLAVVLMIAFLEWCSFNSFTFWIQVRDLASLLADCSVYSSVL